MKENHGVQPSGYSNDQPVSLIQKVIALHGPLHLMQQHRSLRLLFPDRTHLDLHFGRSMPILDDPNRASPVRFRKIENRLDPSETVDQFPVLLLHVIGEILAQRSWID